MPEEIAVFETVQQTSPASEEYAVPATDQHTSPASEKFTVPETVQQTQKVRHTPAAETVRPRKPRPAARGKGGTRR